MAESRLQREITNRTSQERPKQWQQAELLPEPDKTPGYAYRWIRVSTLNNADPRNLSAKLREGWEPVKSADQPRLQLLSNPNGRFPDGIEIGGLLLCKTPSEFVDQRNAHYQKISDGQMQSVDNTYMRESHPKMPLFKERSSEVTFGRR